MICKVFFLMPFMVFSQQLPDKVVIDYDSSGNQIFRGIEIVFAKSTSTIETKMSSDDLLWQSADQLKKKGYKDSRLTYYPNPVIDKLNIVWDLDFKRVDYIIVSSSSGQRLQIVSNLKDSSTTTLDFLSLAAGVYYLRVVYIDALEETVKIIKK